MFTITTLILLFALDRIFARKNLNPIKMTSYFRKILVLTTILGFIFTHHIDLYEGTYIISDSFVIFIIFSLVFWIITFIGLWTLKYWAIVLNIIYVIFNVIIITSLPVSEESKVLDEWLSVLVMELYIIYLTIWSNLPFGVDSKNLKKKDEIVEIEDELEKIEKMYKEKTITEEERAKLREKLISKKLN